MPNIPGIRYNESLAGPVQQGQATPDQFGAGVWRAAGNLGEQVAELTGHLQMAHDEQKATSVAQKARARLQNLTTKLEQGEVAEDGTIIPAPDVGQHEELFQQELQSIQQDAENELGGGRAMSLFASDFTPFASTQEFSMKKNRLNKLKDETLGFLDESLSGAAKEFVDATELEKPLIQDRVLRQVQNAEGRGVISNVEAVKRIAAFNEKVQVTGFMKILADSPENAIAAIENGEFNDVDPVALERMRKSAVEESNSRAMEQDRRATRERIEGERLQAELEEGTAKEGWAMLSDGKLTPKWVMDHRDELSEPKFKMLLDASSGKGATESDPRVYAGLLMRSGKGYDTRKDIDRELRSGRLTIPHANTLYNMVMDNSAAAKKDNRFKSGIEMMERRFQYIFKSADPDAQDKAADAIQQFTKYMADNPDAPEEETTRKAEKLADDARVTTAQAAKETKRLPRYYKGSRGTIDRKGVLDSYREAKRLFDAGEISQRQLEIEALETQEWEVFFPDETKTKQPGEGNK